MSAANELDLALDDARVSIAYEICMDGGARCECRARSGGKWACDAILPIADKIIGHIRDFVAARAHVWLILLCISLLAGCQQPLRTNF